MGTANKNCIYLTLALVLFGVFIYLYGPAVVVTITNPPGATGAAGQPGDMGPAGAIGPAGRDGMPGARGATGPTERIIECNFELPDMKGLYEEQNISP